MQSIRLVFAIVVATWGLSASAARAEEFWDPQQCDDTLIDLVEHLEGNVEDIKQLREMLAEAQRKGETERIAIFEANLESQRVDGIQGKLKRVDTVEYIYCDKAKFDPSLIARVDAVRPWAESTEPTIEAEGDPGLEIATITSIFVPSVDLVGGSCEGPYLDFVVRIINRGAAFPRQVDLDVRRDRWPTVADTWPYLTLILEFKYGNGEHGQSQVSIMAAAKDGVPGGVIPSGGAIDIPIRVRILDNRTSVEVTGRVEGTSLAVNGEEMKSALYTTKEDIPIWDLYTERTVTTSGIDVFDRHVNKPDKLQATVTATIINRGGPTPGFVGGNFIVRRTLDGPSLASVSGQSLAPGGFGILGASKHVPAVFEKPIIVESHIFALCPDGTPGRLADGNIDDNRRVLKEQ